MSIFTEEQQFSRKFVIPLVAFISSLTLGFLILGIIQPYIYGNLNNGYSSIEVDLLISGIFPLIIVLVVDWLLIKAKLYTEISSESIRYRFYPFIQRDKIIYWEEIEKAYVRKYKPIWEFGGWGIRLGFRGKGRAFNMKGNYGLQLEFKNGKNLLIGTQKPEEIKVFLEAIGKPVI
jgi:hypothetical protein